MSGLIIDLFAGGGGASEGIRIALGRDPDVAVNHDPLAVAMHKANHPGTLHVCQDIWSCPPNWATKGKPVALLWGSPDCTHHSKAKGGPPNRDEKRRDLAWVIVKWAREVRPTVIILENVEEFTSWGPCDKDGIPIKSQAGASFRSFKATLRRLGYAVQHRELRACDYGAPTIRKRLFLIARRDGRPIVWPEATHGPGKPLPYRTAAQCIDFSLPCPSIFERKKPLAENTLKRIATGIKRYVLDAAQPFIVTYYGPKKAEDFRGCGMDGLLGTQTTENRHALVTPYFVGAGGPAYGGKPVQADKPFGTLMTENHQALVTPFLTEHANASSQRTFNAEEPLRTQCAQVKGGHFALVAPTMIQTGYGEREGQAPRALDLEAPLGTVVAGGQKHALVSAFMAKHYGGVVGHELERPIGSVTTVDHHSLVTAHVQRDFGNSVGHAADEPCGTVTVGGGGKTGLVTSHLVKLRGTCKDGQPVDEPAPTITSGGTHVGEVRAFLMKYYGEGGQWQSPAEGMHTIPTKDRMGLVTVIVQGQPYVIADIGMRMLQPRELYRAQGFPDSYIIGDDPVQGLALTKKDMVRMCGNSVCPPIAAALIRANYAGALREERDLPLISREVV
jgi:DNA (cytosine-5)-methyltransferase 1